MKTTRPKGKTTDFILSPYKRNNEAYNPVWTITDSYIPYKKEVGELAMEMKLYIKVLKEVMWELSKTIIRYVRKINLPYRLGELSIKKRKNNREYTKQRLDYKYYNETKKILYHCNTHTNKYYFFWDWDNKTAFFTNKSYYKFIPARGNDRIVGKRGLADWIKKCASDPNIKDYDCLIKR